MKRIILVLTGFFLVCASYAQTVEQGEPALVYYSPKTTVLLDFKYTIETLEPGLYAQYAEAMIGTKKCIKANKTVYTLEDVQIRTRTSTDYTRPHKVVAQNGTEPMLLSINEKNLLVGYNLPAPVEQPRRISSKKEETPVRKETVEVAPLPEEVLKAASPLAQAHAIAQQIFHLRETRMYLLNGEVEHAPADGEAMKQVLKELNRQEKALTELFTGRKTVKTVHKEVAVDPENEHYTLYFSEENGFTDAENIEADSVSVAMVSHRQELTQPAEPDKKSAKDKKKKAPELSQIVYNLPGHSEISVCYKGNVLTQRTIPVAQYGVDVPLAKDLFTGSRLPVIVFYEKTGNVKSINL